MKILITGSSKGIGFQIAQELSEHDNELVLHCNSNHEKLQNFSLNKKIHIEIIEGKILLLMLPKTLEANIL